MIDDLFRKKTRSRRNCLIGARNLVGAAVASGLPLSHLGAQTRAPARQTPNLALVSRHLQWTSAEHGIEVAKQAGFPGIVWSVRRGAHIVEANVQSELSRVVRLTRNAGLEVPMIITGISNARSEGAEAVLASMAELGISLYRAFPPRYDYNRPFDDQMSDFRRDLEGLVRLNEKYGTTAAFHTHAGANTIGGSGWDLWIAERGLDPDYVGLNYDIGHVMAKGGAGWRESIRAVGPYLHSVSIKDFRWEEIEAVDENEWSWRTRFVVPGQGMVNFVDFFRYLQGIGFTGPLETYYEYMVDVPGQSEKMNMLGTNYGSWELEIPESTFVGYLKRDVVFYNSVWQYALENPFAPDVSVVDRGR